MPRGNAMEAGHAAVCSILTVLTLPSAPVGYFCHGRDRWMDGDRILLVPEGMWPPAQTDCNQMDPELKLPLSGVVLAFHGLVAVIGKYREVQR